MANIPVTIANGQTTSDAIYIDEFNVIVGFLFDSSFDGTTLAFTAAPDNSSTFVAVEDDTSTPVTITAAASSVSMLTTAAKVAAVAPLKKLKLVAGSQTGATTVTVLTQQVDS